MKTPTLYLLCGSSSPAKSELVASVRNKFDVDVISIDAINARRGYAIGDARIDDSVIAAAVEVLLFEIITAGMTGQSIAIDDTFGEQSLLDRYVSNAKGAGMKVELLTA